MRRMRVKGGMLKVNAMIATTTKDGILLLSTEYGGYSHTVRIKCHFLGRGGDGRRAKVGLGGR